MGARRSLPPRASPNPGFHQAAPPTLPSLGPEVRRGASEIPHRMLLQGLDPPYPRPP